MKSKWNLMVFFIILIWIFTGCASLGNIEGKLDKLTSLMEKSLQQKSEPAQTPVTQPTVTATEKPALAAPPVLAAKVAPNLISALSGPLSTAEKFGTAPPRPGDPFLKGPVNLKEPPNKGVDKKYPNRAANENKTVDEKIANFENRLKKVEGGLKTVKSELDTIKQANLERDKKIASLNSQLASGYHKAFADSTKSNIKYGHGYVITMKNPGDSNGVEAGTLASLEAVACRIKDFQSNLVVSGRKVTVQIIGPQSDQELLERMAIYLNDSIESKGLGQVSAVEVKTRPMEAGRKISIDIGYTNQI